ncbi:hypothetical protein EYF80_005150 [Liparis tanakae]|uniref:Uncharacterized protein n=1 Tax=Liparis tanakae TaxID=230148 RepID=A0A4Z2J313_9TELE|nr:hypothetical protein EYF80_005150 [Liparis tanakae]
MNWIRASSSGSLHFNSTVEQSTTSAFKNNPLASLYSQSSGAGCFCMKTQAKNQNPTPSFSCPNDWTAAHTHTYFGVNVLEDLLDGAMLFDQVDGPLGADSLDGATVVAAQQNTQSPTVEKDEDNNPHYFASLAVTCLSRTFVPKLRGDTKSKERASSSACGDSGLGLVSNQLGKSMYSHFVRLKLD